MAIRSLIETVACQHLIARRKYIGDPTILREAYQASDKLTAKLQAMRRVLTRDRAFREQEESYLSTGTLFDEQ